MPYIVIATLGTSATGRRKVISRRFRTRVEAQRYADATNRDRPGSNARVSKV